MQVKVLFSKRAHNEDYETVLRCSPEVEGCLQLTILRLSEKWPADQPILLGMVVLLVDSFETES